jgi:hypothetical protein
MSENMSIEKRDEIQITWLLYHAGYFSRDKVEKKKDKEVKVQMSPVDCLRMVNAKINGEAVT